MTPNAKIPRAGTFCDMPEMAFVPHFEGKPYAVRIDAIDDEQARQAGRDVNADGDAYLEVGELKRAVELCAQRGQDYPKALFHVWVLWIENGFPGDGHPQLQDMKSALEAGLAQVQNLTLLEPERLGKFFDEAKRMAAFLEDSDRICDERLIRGAKATLAAVRKFFSEKILPAEYAGDLLLVRGPSGGLFLPTREKAKIVIAAERGKFDDWIPFNQNDAIRTGLGMWRLRSWNDARVDQAESLLDELARFVHGDFLFTYHSEWTYIPLYEESDWAEFTAEYGLSVPNP